MGKKSEYKQEAKVIGGDATYVDIELPAVPNGYKRTLQHISCEDETSNFDQLRIGYLTQFDVRHWWVEEEALNAARLYWMETSKVIQAGDRLVVRFTGTEEDDILTAYVDGFNEKVGE